LAAARQRGEQICALVRQLQLHHHRQAIAPITMSCGVAAFPDHGNCPEELLRAADAALYQAKHEGRDRVVIATRSRAAP
jgi:diguanylate cyclase (GGDEF)-like protein